MKRKHIGIVAATSLGVILAVAAALYFYSGGGTATKNDEVYNHEEVSKHGEHNEHEEQKEHVNNKEHDEERVVRLSDKEIDEFGIKIGTAQPGKLNTYITFPGEIVINADKLVHVVPRISGVVQEVFKNVGDHVRSGEVVAVLDSREIAEAKAIFLVARKRVGLAKAIYKREDNLWKQQISSEQDYLEAKQALAEARIELSLAERKLHNLGFSDKYISQLSDQKHISLTRYEIISPHAGTVIEKHITLGEALDGEAGIYMIADMRNVWVDLKIYQKDLPFVEKGQSVLISAGHGIADATGEISYISPIVNEQTRTALARVILTNPDGRWRPGLFVNGKIKLKAIDLPLVVSKTALQMVEGKTSVFVKRSEGFEPKPVTTGRSDDTHIEIISGMTTGERYVMEGAFTLKSELQKKTFGEGHSD